MQLPRGHEKRQERIELRAAAILLGAPWATDTDETDINYGEPSEIDEAEALAANWKAEGDTK